MKRLVWLLAMMVAVAVSAGDVLWRFAPETVDFDPGTTCEKTKNGWTLKHRIHCLSKEAFEIKPNAKYCILIKVRSLSPEKTRLWVITKNIDAQGREIPPTTVDSDVNTVAALDTVIHRGSREIKVAGAEKWPEVKRGTVLVFNAQPDGSDLPNLVYYPIKSIGEDGVVTLDRPLRQDYPAGTFVRRHFRRGPYHSLISAMLNTTEFRVYRRNISGISERGCDVSHWLRGAVKVHIGIGADHDIEVAECCFKEISE